MKVAMWVGFIGWLWVMHRVQDGDLHWTLLAAATVGYLLIAGMYVASREAADSDGGGDQGQP